MQLEFTINTPITFSDAFQMYRQIICVEAKLSRIFGLNVYGFYAESREHNFSIESNLAYARNSFVIADELNSKAILPIEGERFKPASVFAIQQYLLGIFNIAMAP